MIKCEVIKDFTLGESDEFRFEDLKNIQRRRLDTKGKLYYGDTFECTQEMANYLLGNNDKGNVVVKVIEVIPEEINIDIVVDSKKLAEEIITKEKTPKKKKSSKK